MIKSEGYAMPFAMFEICELGLVAIDIDSDCLGARHGPAVIAPGAVAAVSIAGPAENGRR